MADPDLRILARFLPEFERADFSPGRWTGARDLEEGVFTMPYATLSSAALEFVQAAYDGEWVLRDFNWPEWNGTEEAKALNRDSNLLAKATPRQLAQLLTVFIRQDRFVEGRLLDAFESGHILAIVRRAAELLEGGEAPSDP